MTYRGVEKEKTRHRGFVLELIGVLDCIRDYHCKKSVELTFKYIKKKKKRKKYVLLYVTTGLQDYRTTGGDVRLKSGEFFRKPNTILDTKLFSTNARQECVKKKKGGG